MDPSAGDRPEERAFEQSPGRVAAVSRIARGPIRVLTSGNRDRAAAAAVVAATVIVVLWLLVPGAGSRSLQGDEAIYGAVALDSTQSTRVLVAELDGRTYVNKPPLLFWSLRASFALLGPSPFSARLPGILAGLGLALWILWSGARAGSLWAGGLAALLVLSTPTSLGLEGDRGFRHVCTDSLLVLAVAVGLDGWWQWLRTRRPWTLAGSAVAAALGAAAKGPLATLFFGLGILVTPRNAGTDPGTEARRRPSPAVGACLVLGGSLLFTAAWILALELAGTPRIWSRLVGRNLVDRVVQGIDPVHVQPATFFPGTIADDFGPWLALVVPALIAVLRRPRGETAELRRDLALPLLAILAFSLSASKLRWYLLPAYPFLGLALARGAAELRSSLKRPVLKSLFGALILLAVGLRVTGASRRVASQESRPAAPLIAAVASLEASGLERLYVDPGLGFGAPARGLTAEEYFFVGSRAGAERSWPPALSSGDECSAALTAEAPRLREIVGFDPGAVRRIERTRQDVGPLWLATDCPVASEKGAR